MKLNCPHCDHTYNPKDVGEVRWESIDPETDLGGIQFRVPGKDPIQFWLLMCRECQKPLHVGVTEPLKNPQLLTDINIEIIRDLRDGQTTH